MAPWRSVTKAEQVRIVAPDGAIRCTVNAYFAGTVFVVEDMSLDIEPGDELRRKLPNGKDEVFLVTEPTLFDTGRMARHYQIKFTRKGTYLADTGGFMTSANEQDQNDLLDALVALAPAPNIRPSVVEAQIKLLPEWSRERLFAAAEALEAKGAILNPTTAMMHVDLSSTARKRAQPAAPASNHSSSVTYNIGAMNNSPLQHVEAGGHGNQTITYSNDDLRKVIEVYRAHVDELGLDVASRRRADAQVATIEAQLLDEPDPTILKKAGGQLATIIQSGLGGALGNAISSAPVWAPLLSMFG